MDKLLHHHGWLLSHYSKDFNHSRWCRISSINSITLKRSNRVLNLSLVYKHIIGHEQESVEQFPLRVVICSTYSQSDLSDLIQKNPDVSNSALNHRHNHHNHHHNHQNHQNHQNHHHHHHNNNNNNNNNNNHQPAVRARPVTSLTGIVFGGPSCC